MDLRVTDLQAHAGQWRIQDFPQGGGGAPTPKIAIIFHIFAENCMKMKEFGPLGGVCIPGTPPWIRQCRFSSVESLTDERRKLLIVIMIQVGHS